MIQQEPKPSGRSLTGSAALSRMAMRAASLAPADAAGAAELMSGPPSMWGWSALPVRPATARRKPGSAALLHSIAPLRVRPPANTGLSARSRRPPPPRGKPWGFGAVMEATMVFTFQPPLCAGLSGYVAEMGSAFLCAALGIVPTVRHADYLANWLDVLRAVYAL